MIVDFNDVTDLPAEPYDFCVCGSGPAGITVAVKLSKAGKKVALIEGGGKEYTQESQDIFNARTVGVEAWINIFRQRFLGGTSNHWLGRCRPFDESDFGSVPPTGIPGWPIDRVAIEPFLDEASAILDLDTTEGFVSAHEGMSDGMFIADHGKYSDPPTRFKLKYKEDLENSPGLDVYVNANVVNVELADSLDSVSAIDIKNFRGGVARIENTTFVLAMGGVETARLLMNSDSQINTGIGNKSGLLGRCFMEHPKIIVGEFVKKDEAEEGNVEDRDNPRHFEFYTSDALIARENIGKGNFTFHTVRDWYDGGRMLAVKKFFRNLACDIGLEEKVQFISKFKCLGTGEIWTQFEQFPSPESRIYLSEERDALGLRQVVFDWRLSEYDLNTFRKSALQLAKSFSDTGLGNIKLENYMLDESQEIPVEPHAHHMGTTRMAALESDGVVDENCRVFGTDNLYVAGGSIFSTGGGGNPTLSIIQFSLRLADHLLARG